MKFTVDKFIDYCKKADEIFGTLGEAAKQIKEITNNDNKEGTAC